jgi:hypothetical protein
LRSQDNNRLVPAIVSEDIEPGARPIGERGVRTMANMTKKDAEVAYKNLFNKYLVPPERRSMAKRKPKVNVSYETCSIQVLGIDMNCPLCGELVKSGSIHQCSKPKE